MFLGRILRVKGIEQLIDGFALAGLAGEWELVIAGPIQDRELYQLLVNQAEELAIAKYVSALCSTPSVTTPNSGLSEWHKHGGLLCQPTCDGVAAALREVTSWSANERAHRGTNLRNYVTAEFASDVVRSKWAETYLALSNATTH